MMRKRTAALLFAALMLVATVGVAGEFLSFRPSGEFGEIGGPQWHFNTNLKGRITFYDAGGKQFGRFDNDSGDTNGDVRLSVSGDKFDFQGAGKHILSAPDGKSIGYIVVGTTPAADMASEEASAREVRPRDLGAAIIWQRNKDIAAGGSGTASDPFTVSGYDDAAGIHWIVRGKVDVIVLNPEGKVVLHAVTHKLESQDAMRLMQQIEPQLFFDEKDIAVPQIAVIAADKTTFAQGYGAHQITDATGKPLITLVVKPLTAGLSGH
jgi:hypothetical protein